MRRATVFAFPSRYEGFGLPPLEAMRLGVPTVVASTGAAPEVCGDAAVHVPADDIDALAFAIRRLLTSADERAARAAAGRLWAASFTWARTARLTAGVYRELTASIPPDST